MAGKYFAEIWKLGKKIRQVDWEPDIWIEWIHKENEWLTEKGKMYIFSHNEMVRAIWEEFVSKLHLGQEHVGRRVKMRNGNIGLIDKFDANDTVSPLRTSDGFWIGSDGVLASASSFENEDDVVELLT